MAASSYDAAIARLLAHEGGYVNHPSDPGGPTKYGITLAVYRAALKPIATTADVQAMRVDEARAIYRRLYWDAMACDALPAGVDYALFDYSVNSGTARAATVLRRLVSLPRSDTGIDAAAVNAARGQPPAALVGAICDERLAFLKQLKTWPVFGAGWSRRVAAVRADALALARATEAPVAGRVPKRAAETALTATIVVTGAVAAQQSDAGIPTPLLWLVVLGIAAAFAIWFAWRGRSSSKQEA